MVAAVGEQDVRRPAAEIVKRVEERRLRFEIGRRAAPVQEDEQLAIATPTVRDDEDLVQVAPSELAVQREAQTVAPRVLTVAAPPVAQPDPRHAGDEQDDTEARARPTLPRRTDSRSLAMHHRLLELRNAVVTGT